MHFLMTDLLKRTGLINSQKPYENIINKLFNFESVLVPGGDEEASGDSDNLNNDNFIL